MAASRRMRLAAWHFRRSFASSLGLGLVTAIVLLALLGPWIVPYPDHAAGSVNLTGKLQSPSAAHWFGTDEVGNDILTRVIIGARLSLLVGIGITFAAAAIGVPLGILAGTAGGRVREVIMRLTDHIRSLEERIGPWREMTVVPLRAVRRALKAPPALVEGNTAELFRSKIKSVELEAERLQQEAMYDLARHPLLGRPAAGLRWSPPR